MYIMPNYITKFNQLVVRRLDSYQHVPMRMNKEIKKLCQAKKSDKARLNPIE